MKKIKVLVPSGIIGLLEHDRCYTKNSMNRIHNTIISYYLEKGVDRLKEKITMDSKIQFYLYDHLLDKYFDFLREKGYEKESELLRDIYCDYAKKSKEERVKILKRI